MDTLISFNSSKYTQSLVSSVSQNYFENPTINLFCPTEIMNKIRTAGDGMESDETYTENRSKSDLKSSKSHSTRETVPGRLVQIYPTKIITPEKKSSHIYSKTPKFVPYEPYAGAVKPITPKCMTKGTKKSKNHMDINKLISQMSQMDTNINEFKPRNKLTSCSDKSEMDSDKLSENKEMQKKIEQLTKENENLQEQLKQQAQVTNTSFKINKLILISD